MSAIPSGDPRIPTLMGLIRDLQHEVELLKQSPRGEFNPRQHRQEVTFSFHGLLESGTTKSGIYQVKESSGVIQRIDWNGVVRDDVTPDPDPDPDPDDPGPIGGEL